MALSKGKKVLIAVVAGVVAIGAVIATVFAVKNVAMTYRPGITTPVNPGQNEGQKPGQDEGQKPGQDEGQEPGGGDEGQQGGGDEGQDPGQDDEEQGEEEPETPEMSEEDYRIQNVEVLKEILAREYKEFSKTDNATYNLENIDNIKINAATGDVTFTADARTIAFGVDMGLEEGYNFTGHFGKSFDWQNQEELNIFLTSFNDSESDMTFEDAKTTMSSKISEATYDKFVDYVKGQSYDGVDFSVVSDDDVFGVTWFIPDNDAYGYNYIEYKIANNGNVYTLHMEWFPPLSTPDKGIEEIITNKNGVFKVVDVQPFEEFDINTEIGATAQAQSEFFLDLSEVAISKDQAQDLANAIRTSNPKKLGNMEVKLPAGNPDFEF